MHLYLQIIAVVLGTVLSPIVSQAAEEKTLPGDIRTTQAGRMVAEKTSQELLILKDPTISAFLSFSIPGLGQVYTHKYLRGALFFGAEAACFITAGALVNILGGYEYEVDDVDNETHLLEGSDFNTLSDGAKAAVISTMVLGVALHIWNTVDAYHQAEKYNRETFRLSDDGLWFRIGVDPARETFSLSLFRAFHSLI